MNVLLHRSPFDSYFRLCIGRTARRDRRGRKSERSRTNDKKINKRFFRSTFEHCLSTFVHLQSRCCPHEFYIRDISREHSFYSSTTVVIYRSHCRPKCYDHVSERASGNSRESSVGRRQASCDEVDVLLPPLSLRYDYSGTARVFSRAHDEQKKHETVVY